MKKLVLKTSFITFGVTIILLVSVFGILSLFVPYEMSDFSLSIGLDTLSGDYAYQEYERSGSVRYLARSFEIASQGGSAQKAEHRFELLIEHEEFDSYCEKQDANSAQSSTTPHYRYRDYIYGRGACVKYRLAKTEAEMRRVCRFALDNTGESFRSGNPYVLLAIDAANKNDGSFCKILLEETDSSGMEFEQNSDYASIRKILEGCANE